jgi:ribosomal protein S17
MKNLEEVLQFIKTANKEELEIIKNAFDVRKSEITHSIKSSLKVGDNVSINHRKIAKNRMFFVIKINGVNVKVGEVGSKSTYTVAPSLLVKV